MPLDVGIAAGLLSKGLLSLGGLMPARRTGPARGISGSQPAATPVAEIVAPPRQDRDLVDEALRLPKEAEAALREIGMPPCSGWTGKRWAGYDRPRRVADTPQEAASRFVVWLRAIDETGKYRADQVLDLLWVFAEHDHRQLPDKDQFLHALAKHKAVRKQQLQVDNRARTYTITPGRLKPAPVRAPKRHSAMHTARKNTEQARAAVAPKARIRALGGAKAAARKLARAA